MRPAFTRAPLEVRLGMTVSASTLGGHRTPVSPSRTARSRPWRKPRHRLQSSMSDVRSGALSLGTLIVVCWFGSFTGDVIRFWIGRRYGARLLDRFPRFERPVQTVVRLTDRHYVWMILFHRFPHGIRGLAGFAYGISRLPWSTFLALNFVAAGLWSGTVVSAGYAFGQFSETSINNASSGLGIVMLVAFLGLSWLLSRKLDQIVQRY